MKKTAKKVLTFGETGAIIAKRLSEGLKTEKQIQKNLKKGIDKLDQMC